MFGMMTTKIVTTNLRIPDYNLLELKTLAAGQGVSVNEYINRLINEYAIKHVMAPDIKIRKLRKEKSVWEALRNLSKSVKKEPLGELSDDEKAIYET